MFMRGLAVATLADLKARIADDLTRTDITSQIAAAITDAITHYQDTRFYFNETRNSTFYTVASQQIYDVADLADIPKFTTIDGIFVTVSGRVCELSRDAPRDIEIVSDSSVMVGQPWTYSYFDQSLRLYPVPDQAYLVRMQGHIRKDAPASDIDEGNVWMNEAFELIRCLAKKYLAAHVLKDPDLFQMMEDREGAALGRLVSSTSKRIATGRIRPTQF